MLVPKANGGIKTSRKRCYFGLIRSAFRKPQVNRDIKVKEDEYNQKMQQMTN